MAVIQQVCFRHISSKDNEEKTYEVQILVRKTVREAMFQFKVLTIITGKNVMINMELICSSHMNLAGRPRG